MIERDPGPRGSGAHLGDLDGKRILVRTDFNVPLDGDGEIVDDFRIRAALPTIEWLTERGASVVTASHLGRPKGAPDPKYSMDPVRARLAELAPGVELLENLRFDPGETANDPAFVAKLVDGIDGYVNDAFGASHRAHASIVGPPQFVPSAMGRLLQKEVEVLLGLRNKPKHPFVAVLGGAKISDKLGVVEALLDVVDSLVIGGAMCFTFFAAQGKPIGDSLFEPDQVDTCGASAADADAKGKTIHLPDDITGTDADGNFATFGTRLPDGAKGFDIGPGSAAAFTDVIMDARMVFWNGPMGMFEDERFDVRHPNGRAGDGRHEGVHRRRWWRLRRGACAVPPRRRGRPRLHRRRRQPRTARERRSARPRRPPQRNERNLMTTRRPLISGNWKMNLNHFEAIQTVQKLHYLVPKDTLEDVDVSIHPPFTDIRSIQTVIETEDFDFHLGAQHCHWEDTGAFTGEVSPAFLAKLNVKYVIVGHCERRELFGETDEMVNKKVPPSRRTT